MKKKELNRIAEKLAKAEYIIQTSDDPKAAKVCPKTAGKVPLSVFIHRPFKNGVDSQRIHRSHADERGGCVDGIPLADRSGDGENGDRK